jgi:acyl transferase domain-containing protein
MRFFCSGGEFDHRGKVMGNDIAIVGMSCRAPGANDYQSLWLALREGRISYGPWPAARRYLSRIWSDTILESEALKKRVESAMVGGYLRDVDQFDAALFGISAREANAMDPQHRLILESVWAAVQDACIDPRSLAGSRTGVYVGISTFDYSFLTHEMGQRINAYSGLGATKSLAANRISHAFDLRGPSFALDSACSSALVGVHQASVALMEDECELALVASSNLILSPGVSYSFANARMLSPSGQCLPFRTSANGYVRGEGVGAVVLKRLDHARRDGNPIHAIIAGSAINQDGRTPGITVPSIAAQVDVIQLAWQRAGVGCNDIAVFETHGTGTPAGDRAELAALATVFAERSSRLPACQLGAVKANVGHAESAAGMLSIIKMVGALQAREVAPLAGDGTLPEIPIGLAFTGAPTHLQPCSDTGLLYGAVSAFGFGGTNAHLALMAPPPPPRDASHSSPVLITVSANKEESLEELRERWLEWIVTSPSEQLAAAALSSNRAFGGEEKRLYVLVEHGQAALERLRTASVMSAYQSPIVLCIGDVHGLSEGPLDFLTPESRTLIGAISREQGATRADQCTQIALAMRLRDLMPTAQILDGPSNHWLQRLWNREIDHTQALASLAAADSTEVSDGQTLSSTLPSAVRVVTIGVPLARTPVSADAKVYAMSPSRADALAVLGSLWASGGDIRLSLLAPPSTPGLHGIPAYPFCRQRYWLSPTTDAKVEETHLPRSVPKSEDSSDDIPIELGNLAYLREHRIGGVVVVPGASLVDLAMTHATARFNITAWQAQNVEFHNPVFLDQGDDGVLLLKLQHRSAGGKESTVNFQFLSRAKDISGVHPTARVHALGELYAVPCGGEA